MQQFKCFNELHQEIQQRPRISHATAKQLPQTVYLPFHLPTRYMLHRQHERIHDVDIVPGYPTDDQSSFPVSNETAVKFRLTPEAPKKHCRRMTKEALYIRAWME
ncbi:hypothetical protein BaRGS_00013674 [Batillaria attramentaria]|uniref:Uncharacterized protein n=1 Tax=Batillaria attramentaria TaxID=370345 RepID=A0ABD0L6Q3_9CAEN